MYTTIRSEASRQRVYDAIERYMDAHPDQRLGQLLTNVVLPESGAASAPLFYIEDDALVLAIHRFGQREPARTLSEVLEGKKP